ncbi:MAG: hypothetical protein ABUU24_02850, partial [Variovorax sp.]
MLMKNSSEAASLAWRWLRSFAYLESTIHSFGIQDGDRTIGRRVPSGTSFLLASLDAMNFQQLRSVREAVRCGFNLTEAAHALHTSQPGV